MTGEDSVLHVPDDLWDRISSGDLVLLVEPGRHFHPLGPATLRFDNQETISIEIRRTSNCKLKDIPLTDLSLSGFGDVGELLSWLMKRAQLMGFLDEITIIRFDIRG